MDTSNSSQNHCRFSVSDALHILTREDQAGNNSSNYWMRLTRTAFTAQVWRWDSLSQTDSLSFISPWQLRYTSTKSASQQLSLMLLSDWPKTTSPRLLSLLLLSFSILMNMNTSAWRMIRKVLSRVCISKACLAIWGQRERGNACVRAFRLKAVSGRER